MIIKPRRWKNLFLFCFGLSLGTAICMKMLEPRFQAGGSTFTIIGLEITYPLSKLESIFQSMDSHVRSLLRFQLLFDFVFMAGIYPTIAALCMMAAEKWKGTVRKLLIFLACLQMLAWACDIYENSCLLKWMDDPSSISSFATYHIIVGLKWILALGGFLAGVVLLLWKRNRN